MKGLTQTLRARWIVLATRERIALVLAAAVLGAFAVWSVLLSPALSTLTKTDAQQRTLEGQLQRMLVLQATAHALQAQTRSSREATVRALERTLGPLGANVRLSVVGAQLTLTLTQVPAPVLADWLIQSRVQSRMQASEIRLTRNSTSSAAAWDGTLVFDLPPG